MEARATARFVRIAPRKARAVVDLIRGRSAEEAMALLKFVPRRAASIVEKVLKSAIANAEHNYDLDASDLIVAKAFVDQGPALKRWHPRQRGRAFPISIILATSQLSSGKRGRDKGDGSKVHPKGLRVGIIKGWDSKWYAGKKDYVKFLHEDVKLRKFIKQRFLRPGFRYYH